MVDGVFNRLRQKLDALGYQQVLPLGAVPLVGAIFEDLVKTTESLRDAKMQIGILLEEKSCWELGVEPYKCDNSKLLAECNSLHLDIIKQREFFEDKICEYTQKIRNLESDKRYLEDHSIGLENQIREISAKNDSKFLKNKKNGEKMNKKPFVSTVKSGGLLPSQNTDSYSSHKCMKCNSVIWAKRCDDNSNEIEKLQNDIKGQSNQLTICMKKVEARDREILRLNGLLLGGRPVAALAKDCCYKDIGPLTEDVELLQKEKHENLKMLRESRESMHEAMERALKLDEKNKKLEQDLKEFEKTALKMENQANLDVLEKEKEILKLKSSINILKNNQCPDSTSCFSEKPVLMEKLNVSTLREKALEEEINRLNNKNAKLKNKLMIQRKDSGAKTLKEEQNNFDFIRLKAERDFFHKEYLNMVEKMGSEKEHNFHRCSDNTKLFQSKFGEVPAERIGSSQENMLSSNSITAAILRAERERDIFKSELNIMRLEKSSLDEKLKLNMEMHLKEKHKFEQDLHEMQIKLSMLEKENLDMKRIQVPGQTHTVLMKEEISELRQQIYDLQIANNKINTAYNQLKILQDQTEKSLVEHQNKLLVAETHLENAESRLSCLSTNKDSTRNELGEMRNEIAVLKSSNATLEHEKDKLLIDLDIKTEKIYHLELDNQKLNKQKFELNQTIQDLNNKLERIANEKKERECELHDTSIESKTLRQHIATIKSSRDQALSDNGRLSNDLADVQAELNLVKRKLKDSEKKSDALKQQLEQYVLEVRRAEEILLLKEREREEMLEHYRCLSHDAVMLEGNNHSLEIEAAEQKRQLADTESQISNLKQELATKDGCIGKLEKQISLMSSQISSLENELEQANDDQRMLTVDLDAMKELCSKLDLQRDKINAELEECNNIRVHLEHENEILRKQISHDRLDDKCAVGSMQDLLAGNYQELENQRKISNQLNQEVIKLKKRIDELQLKVTEESHKTVCNEALAKEYSVQIQELRHNITNDRFQHAKEKEDSARYSVQKESSESSNSVVNENNIKTKTSKVHQNDKSLLSDIKKFLKKGKIKESYQKYSNDISFDEDSSDIIVRQHIRIEKKSLSQKNNTYLKGGVVSKGSNKTKKTSNANSYSNYFNEKELKGRIQNVQNSSTNISPSKRSDCPIISESSDENVKMENFISVFTYKSVDESSGRTISTTSNSHYNMRSPNTILQNRKLQSTDLFLSGISKSNSSTGSSDKIYLNNQNNIEKKNTILDSKTILDMSVKKNNNNLIIQKISAVNTDNQNLSLIFQDKEIKEECKVLDIASKNIIPPIIPDVSHDFHKIGNSLSAMTNNEDRIDAAGSTNSYYNKQYPKLSEVKKMPSNRKGILNVESDDYSLVGKQENEIENIVDDSTTIMKYKTTFLGCHCMESKYNSLYEIATQGRKCDK